MSSLKGRNILITGASSGIGKATAIHLSRVGANIIMVARNEERLQITKGLLHPGNHIAISQDITDFLSLKNTIEEVGSQIGKIAGFVHCAGIEKTIPLNMMNLEIYNQLFNTNALAAFEISKILSRKKYLPQDGASFVFISSVMGSNGQTGKIGYCSSKSALIGGAKAMALELAKKKIRVNTISPGMVKTEMSEKMFSTLPEATILEMNKMHPLGIGQPEDIANACEFLLSDKAKWITGIDMLIDGGYSAK